MNNSSAPTEYKLLLTPDEAAKAMGISRSHVYALIYQGALESVLIGRRTRRISISALETFTAQRRDTTRLAHSEGGKAS